MVEDEPIMAQQPMVDDEPKAPPPTVKYEDVLNLFNSFNRGIKDGLVNDYPELRDEISNINKNSNNVPKIKEEDCSNDSRLGPNRKCYYEYIGNRMYCSDENIYNNSNWIFNKVKDNYLFFLIYDVANLCATEVGEVHDKAHTERKFIELVNKINEKAGIDKSVCHILIMNEYIRGLSKGANFIKKVKGVENIRFFSTRNESDIADECDDKAILYLTLLLTCYKRNKCVVIYSEDNYTNVQHFGRSKKNKDRNIGNTNHAHLNYPGSSVFYEEIVPYFYNTHPDYYNYLINEFASKMKVGCDFKIILNDATTELNFINYNYIIVAQIDKIPETINISDEVMINACGYGDTLIFEPLMNLLAQTISMYAESDDNNKFNIHKKSRKYWSVIINLLRSYYDGLYNHVKSFNIKCVEELKKILVERISLLNKMNQILMTEHKGPSTKSKFAPPPQVSLQYKYIKYKTKYLNLLNKLNLKD